MLLTGRTKISSRGQIVIPKLFREMAGLDEGDEIEVSFDGEHLTLSRLPAPDRGVAPELERAAVVVTETPAPYGVMALDKAHHGDGICLSDLLADRISALAEIKRLAAGFSGISSEEAFRESRGELEKRQP